MAHYGELLNTFEPEKDNFYLEIDKYFNYPVLTKTKDVDMFSVYMIKTQCLLSTENRYLIVMVQKDNNNIGEKEKLSNLFWISLQTRTLPEQHDIDVHSYRPELKGSLYKKIDRIDITKELSTYSCDSYPIKIIMLHKKANIVSEYQSTGNIISAIETYQTVISFLN
jgi:hypothetical protein